MNAHDRIRKRFEKLVRDARAAGPRVVADAGAIAIRLIPVGDIPDDDPDLNGLGETVPVDSSCGGGTSVNLEMSCG